MDTHLIESLIEAIQENTARSSELITLIKREQQPWIDPDEAARLLGFTLTESRSHRRKVIQVMRRLRPKAIREGRPPAYFRPAILELAQERALGRVYY